MKAKIWLIIFCLVALVPAFSIAQEQHTQDDVITSGENLISVTRNFLDSIRVAEENNQIEEACELYITFGVLAYRQTDYITALEYLQKSVEKAESINNQYLLANSYNNMSAIYMDMDEYRKALRYLKIAYDFLPEAEKYNEGGYYIQSNIFKNYLNLNILDSAELYLGNLDETTAVNGTKEARAIFLEMKGNYYHYQKKYKESNACYFEILHDLDVENDDNSFLNIVLKNLIGENYYYLKQYTKAAKYLTEVHLNGGLTAKVKASLLLSRIEKEQGNFPLSLKYYEVYSILNDSLNNRYKIQEITQQEMRYEFNKILLEKEAEQEIQEARMQTRILRQRWILFSLLAGFVAVIFLTLYIMRNIRREKERNLLLAKQKQEISEKNDDLTAKNSEINQLLEELKIKNNQLSEQADQLKELDKIKSQFFANISHEFRTPLSLIQAKTTRMIQACDSDSEMTGSLKNVIRNSRSLLKLVNQLLDLSKIEAGVVKVDLHTVNAVPFVKRVVMSWHSFAETTGISLTHTEKIENAVIDTDIDKLEAIINNLISNAIKFTPEGEKIEVEQNIIDDKYTLIIADTGEGMTRESLKSIFKRFYQVENVALKQKEGIGIGLSIVKEFVSLLNGEIAVESEPDKGTRFTITFPLSKSKTITQIPDTFEPEREALPFQEPSPTMQEMVNEFRLGEKQEHKILLVEDNDEMREYIREELVDRYQVVLAKNGQEGVEKAFEEIPDLIISDVMMPVMDGYGLCKAIKSDLRTNHIPIILLTAKALKENVVEGFMAGTDDYITKPFETELLLLKIRNTLTTRQQLTQKLKNTVLNIPTEQNTDSVEEQFISEILGFVLSKIDDPELNVDALASQFNMSKPTLNRKMRALLNMSTKQFVNTVRMQKAAELIKLKKESISEIAHAVGFTHMSHFSKSFKEYHGFMPSEYLKNSPKK